MAEAVAARYSGQRTKDTNRRHCTIELESEVVTDLLRNNIFRNLITHRSIIKDTIALTEGKVVSFTYCYREANMDYLAKLSTTLYTPLLTQDINQLPYGDPCFTS